MRAMNAGMKNGINLLMILVLFISCVQEKEDNNVLRRVEACMELFPDSALSLLSQIECPECMRGQQRADYALLLTQALDKNYLDNLQLLGLIANNEKRYPQAIEYFSNAMEVCDNLNDKYRYSLSLGRVYSEVGQKKKAEDCFVSCINATNIFVSSGAYYYLADMHKKDGNYLKAFLYKEKSDSLLEVTRNAELQKQLLDLQNKYENDKLILENKQIRLENEKQTYFYLFLFVFILGLGIIAFFLVCS